MKQRTGFTVPVAKPKPISPAQEIANTFARIGKLSEGGKKEEAWTLANELHGKYPNEALPNFAMAVMLRDDNQGRKSLRFAEKAVEAAPTNAAHQVFLGKLYVELYMNEFALPTLKRAIALDSKIYQASWALGQMYYAAGQGKVALPYFDAAFEIAPREARQQIHLERAQCYTAMGRVEEAVADLEAIFEVPHLRAQALSSCLTLLKGSASSPYAMELAEELKKENLTNRYKSKILLSLARSHEHDKDFDRAFELYQRSRSLVESTSNLSHTQKFNNDCIANLTPDVFARFADYGNPTDKPIFIIGMPRSGTTMTEQIVGSHSQATGVGELRRMSGLSGAFAKSAGIVSLLRKMESIGPDKWKSVPQQYLNLLDVLAPGARFTVDKMPHNFVEVGFIRLCFPNAKFIHCRRHPFDNFISAYQHDMNAGHGYSYDQLDYAKYYLEYLRLMDHWKKVLPGQIHDSVYEEITANPEKGIRDMLDFLGLPWEDSCLNFHERDTTVLTFSRLQVRSPINTSSVARWKRYEKHLQPMIAFFEAAGINVS